MKFDILTERFNGKERERHVPLFNRPPGKDSKLWSAWLTAALKEKGLGAKIVSPGDRGDAASP